MCSTVLWKIELVNNATQYLSEVIFEQSVEGTPWVFLTSYNKKQE